MVIRDSVLDCHFKDVAEAGRALLELFDKTQSVLLQTLVKNFISAEAHALLFGLDNVVDDLSQLSDQVCKDKLLFLLPNGR